MQPDIVQYSNLSKDDFIELANTFGELKDQHGEGISYTVSAASSNFPGSSSSKGAAAIPPHTEFPFQTHPPLMLGLWCERPADCGGATVVMEIERIRSALYSNQRELIDRGQLDFGGDVGLAPIYDGVLARYSHNLLVHSNYYPDGDERNTSHQSGTARIASKISAICFNHGHRFRLQRGAAIFWNNHRMLHARERFSDINRCLHRVTIY